LLCLNPDEASKTCSGIYAFEPISGREGTFTEIAEVLVSSDQPLSIEVSSVINVSGPTMCGTTRLSDLENGRIRANGAHLPPDQNSSALGEIINRLKPLAGREACETLRVEAGQLLKFGRLEGVRVDLPGKPAAWIAPDAGYKVAPKRSAGVQCITCR
jgi:hypothetical protein